MSSSPLSLAFVGLSAAERLRLESALRPPGRRQPAYRLTPDPDRAALLVADADDPEVVARLRRSGRLGCTVAVGDRPWPRVAWQLPRPLDTDGVLHALARLATATTGEATQPATRESRRVLDALADFAARSVPTVEHALVVDTDATRLRQMAEWLARLGIEPQLAQTAAEALTRLERDPISFVFVAPELEGMDGFQLVRAIRRLPLASPPTLVLLARATAPSDCVRAAAAGCDHCVEPPLRAVDLQRIVGTRDPDRLPFVRTAQSDPAF